MGFIEFEEQDGDSLSLRVEMGGRRKGFFLKGFFDLKVVREEEGSRFKASIFVGADV